MIESRRLTGEKCCNRFVIAHGPISGHFGAFWRIFRHAHFVDFQPESVSQLFDNERFPTGDPGRNRTCTYGFGGHRPIHWTTGPVALHGGHDPYPASRGLARTRIVKFASTAES